MCPQPKSTYVRTARQPDRQTKIFLLVLSSKTYKTWTFIKGGEFLFHSCDYNTFSFYILRMWWESKNTVTRLHLLPFRSDSLFYITSKIKIVLIKGSKNFCICTNLLRIVTIQICDTPSIWIFFSKSVKIPKNTSRNKIDSPITSYIRNWRYPLHFKNTPLITLLHFWLDIVKFKKY